MVPGSPWTSAPPSTAPRARGDGPRAARLAQALRDCSPRTRGWSPSTTTAGGRSSLLPAHAGMVPAAAGGLRRRVPAPRARGDGPWSTRCSRCASSCSPRTRGWSQRWEMSPAVLRLLPAHAGMVPSSGSASTSATATPRARGDGPRELTAWMPGRTCSPRTRGWSQPARMPTVQTPLLPAHAGMVPARQARLPRPGPAPRARGDGPEAAIRTPAMTTCSPRTRGWSPAHQQEVIAAHLLPAHAGMVPGQRPYRPGGRSAPRARGDGPVAPSRRCRSASCSPRTRGWSQGGAGRRQELALLPAHAGMVPCADPPRRPQRPAPRARGDGPLSRRPTTPPADCSPRTRGWSRPSESARRGSLLLPAHAGMIPSGPDYL